MKSLSVGFIGTGQMSRALASGLAEAGLVSPARMIGSDPSAQAREAFEQLLVGTTTTDDNAAVLDQADIVFLAVKPQHLQAVLPTLVGRVSNEILFVSILAGVRLEQLTRALGTERMIRVMPNTPCLVAKGASAFCRAAAATPEDAALVQRMLEAVGVATELPESLLDAVTGLSGSGPAFGYQIIESLSDGGVRMGLPREIATMLAAQTVYGAAAMVLETGEHPGVLKDRVASPGGTTIAGLHALAKGGLSATLIDAVQAATIRSQELGKVE